MANLGLTPVQVVANKVTCGRCGGELPPTAAGATIRARYLGPEIAEVAITDGQDDQAHLIHRCPPEPEL